MLKSFVLLRTSQRIVTLLLAICCPFIWASEDVEKNMQQMQHFFMLDKQTLPHDPVVKLSGSIIQNRNLYTSNTVAKAYLLLAQVATNKGDAARAFQFATDGLSLPSIDTTVQMQLRVKLASGYYIKGKYLQVLTIAEQILAQANDQVNLQFRLLAIAYKSMAYALLSDHEHAFDNLRELQNYLRQNDQYSDHIELLEILAIAYFNLGDYSTAVTIQQKLLNLRLSLSGDKLLEKSYYDLASTYYQMDKLDDAYHAFWQANHLAEKNNLPIRLAYSKLGLGKILVQQQEYQQAYKVLSSSVSLFQGQNLTKPYLSALTYFAKTAIILGDKEQGYELLTQALLLSENIQLSSEQVELFLLLARMFKDKKNFELSTEYLEKYIELKQLHTHQQIQNQQAIKQAKEQGNRSRRIALELAEKSELGVDYDKKFKQQQQWINLLISLLLIGLLALIWRWFRNRANKLSQDYDEAEKPKHFLPNSTQTKIWYQNAYKMARKYDYPIAIGYMSIENWTKLPRNYNEKTMNEVLKAIAVLINEHNNEFNYAGVISDGEYLFLAPHWSTRELNELLVNLSKAFELRFFANLGDLSLTMRYAVETPSVQDIDPYIFLSRLSDAVHN